MNPHLSNLKRLTDLATGTFEGIKCKYCEKVSTDEEEILFIEEFGMCLGCDHVSSDVMADRKALIAEGGIQE